jgi:hypothetical protein
MKVEFVHIVFSEGCLIMLPKSTALILMNNFWENVSGWSHMQ